MKPVGIGLVGLGAFGEKHLAALASLPDARVIALCSRTPGRAAALAERYGVARWYTDYRELVADPEVDVVDVCTRDFEHVEPTVAAAGAGKHVFLEKPIGGSWGDGQKILAAVEQAGVILMVGHILRFDERHIWLKDRIQAGELGKLASMYLKRNITRRNYYSGRAVSPILGSHIHDIDLALWLSGEQVVEVYTAKNHALGGPMLDVAWTVLRFESGLLATCHTAWLVPHAASRLYDSYLEVVGTAGTVQIDSTNQGVTLWKDDLNIHPDTNVVDGVPSGALRAELEYFVSCVQSGKAPTRITTQEAWEAFRIACTAMEAAERGVPLKPIAW